jgi:ATP-dependent Clp protease ATP-binding subunit ClpA
MLLESAKSMIAQAMQKGGVSPKTLAKPIETCIKVGMNSYFQLKPEQREQIDSLVQAALKYAESLKPQYPKIMEYVSNLNTANVTALIKIATKVLRKKSTAALVQQYLDVYVTVVNNPRRLKAIGAYMVCLLSNLDCH